MGKTILVVDDEKNIVDILTFNLNREGYTVISAADGREGLNSALTMAPDLILLDVMLPYMDGFEVCERIREKDGTTPIIMLTAREEESDKVLGLELGADDYIVKPFSIRELIARVKTNIRRTIGVSAVPAEDTEHIMRIGDIVVDTEKYAVFKNGRELSLTQREFDLIKCLVSEPGKIFSREELMSQVWNYDYYGDVRTVDVAIRRLREKIEDDSTNPVYIITKRGAGYYFGSGK